MRGFAFLAVIKVSLSIDSPIMCMQSSEDTFTRITYVDIPQLISIVVLTT